MNQIVKDVITCQNVLYENRGFKNPIQKYHLCYPVSLCISTTYFATGVAPRIKGGIILIKRKGFKNKVPCIHIWCEYYNQGRTEYIDPTYLQYETDKPTDNQIKIEKIFKDSLDYDILEDSIVDIPPSDEEKMFLKRLIELQYNEGITLSESINIVKNEINLNQISFDLNEAYAFGCSGANKINLLNKYNELIDIVYKEAREENVKKILEDAKINFTIMK